MQKQIESSSQSKGQQFFVKKGEKRRLRFLADFNDAEVVTFHNNWEKRIEKPCLKHYDKKCPLCKDDSMKTYEMYAWPVWDYDANKVKIFLYKCTAFSPIPSIISIFEDYDSIMGRDIIIKRINLGDNTRYEANALDKSKFKFKKNVKGEIPDEEEFFKLLAEMYELFEDDYDGDDDDEDEDDDYDEDDDDDDEMSLQEQLEDMDFDDLKSVAIELKIKVKKSHREKPKKLIKLILEEDEDDIAEAIEESQIPF